LICRIECNLYSNLLQKAHIHELNPKDHLQVCKIMLAILKNHIRYLST